MKPPSEHAPKCNCPLCAPACWRTWTTGIPNTADQKDHGCMEMSMHHRGPHKCCCGEVK